MAIVNCLMPMKNLWLLASIICLFSSQMILLRKSSCAMKHITERLGWIWQCMWSALVLIFSMYFQSVSPFHRILCHICSSRSPTRSGSPHLSLTLRAVGRTAGQGAELLSAGSGHDALQRHHSGVTPFHINPPYNVTCSLWMSLLFKAESTACVLWHCSLCSILKLVLLVNMLTCACRMKSFHSKLTCSQVQTPINAPTVSELRISEGKPISCYVILIVVSVFVK